MVRGVALEEIAGHKLGEAFLGGNVEAIDVFQKDGAAIAGSFRTHEVDASAPDYEQRLIRAIRADANELKGIENRRLAGTTSTGASFAVGPGKIQLKFLMVGVPENRALVLQSRSFVQAISRIAAATETAAAEGRLIILPLPVKNWKGK